MQLQEKAQIKAQEAEYNETFNAYVAEVEAAKEARNVEFEARKREQNVKAREVLEEQIQERRVSHHNVGRRLSVQGLVRKP
jgi:hypothetical protein